MNKIKTSRFYSLITLNLVNFIFPPTLVMERGKLSLKSHDSLLFFWDTTEEIAFMRDVSAVTYDPGIIWDKLIVVSRSGSGTIAINGLKKGEGRRVKNKLLLIR